MSDELATSPAGTASAGQLLRQAREAAGLELETLSATIKVAQRKLESLEAGRYDELPDAVFTRALALTVCRALKIDAAPVLSLLPAAKEAPGLEHVTQGLNQPFNERGGSAVRLFGGWWGGLLRPAVLAPICLVAGAALLYFWPHRLPLESPATTVAASAPKTFDQPASDSTLTASMEQETAVSAPPHASEPPDVSPNAGEFPVAASAPASAASAPVTAAKAVTLPAAPQAPTPPAVAAGASLPQPSAAGDPLSVKTKEDSWIDVRDAKGRVLVSKLFRAGESLTLTGVAPLQVKVGNAHGTELQFRGRAVDLAAIGARDNVARLELK